MNIKAFVLRTTCFMVLNAKVIKTLTKIKSENVKMKNYNAKTDLIIGKDFIIIYIGQVQTTELEKRMYLRTHHQYQDHEGHDISVAYPFESLEGLCQISLLYYSIKMNLVAKIDTWYMDGKRLTMMAIK